MAQTNTYKQTNKHDKKQNDRTTAVKTGQQTHNYKSHKEGSEHKDVQTDRQADRHTRGGTRPTKAAPRSHSHRIKQNNIKLLKY